MKWEDLVKLEPRLRNVERLAEDANADGLDWPTFWLQAATELGRLVGFMAKEPRLRSTRAYEVAMEHINSTWAIGPPRDRTPHARPWDGVTGPWWADDAPEQLTLPGIEQ